MRPQAKECRGALEDRQPPRTLSGLFGLAYTSGMMNVQEMVIYGVSFDVIGKQPIVLLKTMEGNRFLPIWIGHPEAAAILIKLQGTELPRPMTHDLLMSIIGTFQAEVARITVTELRESTFYATLTLNKDGAEIDIDSRPSDALALAVRTEAPIFASTDLVNDTSSRSDVVHNLQPGDGVWR